MSKDNSTHEGTPDFGKTMERIRQTIAKGPGAPGSGPVGQMMKRLAEDKSIMIEIRSSTRPEIKGLLLRYYQSVRPQIMAADTHEERKLLMNSVFFLVRDELRNER